MAKNNMWLIIAVAVIAIVGFNQGWFSGADTPTDVDAPVDKTDCEVEDISMKWNDLDFYKLGTDPASGLYILPDSDVSPQTVADDGNLDVGTYVDIHALAGEDSSTYFSEEIEFNVDCTDPYFIPNDLAKLKKAGAPTLTFVNDDGVTKNANGTSSMEDVSASSTYTFEVTARSPSEQCASAHGAVFACEVDATYVQNVERDSGDIEKKDFTIYNAHATYDNGAYDQWYTFEYGGDLCDGAKDVFTLKYTTTSTTPTDNGASLNCTWFGKDYDVDADSLDLIGPAIYDEDNNGIYLAGASKVHETY